jgi:adenylate cyclase
MSVKSRSNLSAQICAPVTASINCPAMRTFPDAISAYMVGDNETAIEMADQAVALNPNSFNAWHARGWVYRSAGLPEEALRSFERAIRMSPVDPQLYAVFAGMAEAFIELGRFDEAIVARKKALRHNPSFSAGYRLLAAAFAHLGRDDEARCGSGACA